jgi:hypothetical protein
MLSLLRLRMLLVGAALVLGWVGYLAIASAKEGLALQERESEVRGLIVAESLASSIGRAVGYGIDMADLRGIDQVFASRIEGNKPIVEIVLDDLDGKAQVPVAGPRRQGVSVSAIVKTDNEAVGRVTVYLSKPSVIEAISAPIAAALLIMLVVLLTIWEGINYATRRGPGLREAATRGLVAQMTELDFKSVVKIANLNRLDIRSAWLSTQIRDLNERFTRISRLIASLRQTEPSSSEQLRLMELVRQARGEARFAAGRPLVNKLSPMAIDIRWLVFIATTSVSVNHFGIDKALASHFFTGPLMLALGLMAAMCGYGLVKVGARSRSDQTICLAGLFLLGGVPLAFILMSLGGNASPQIAGSVETWIDSETRNWSRAALSGLQSMGLGIFLAGLRRYLANDAFSAAGRGQLPLVVISAWILMGASLTWIWSEILGGKGVMLMSFGLVMVTYFFYASFPLQMRASDAEPQPVAEPPKARRVTATTLGFVLGTVIATSISGFSPAGTIEAPEFLPWPLLAMSLGFLAQIRPFKVTPFISALGAFLAAVALLAAMRLELPGSLILSVLALAVVTYHVVNVLPDISENLTSRDPNTSLLYVALGMVASLLFFAMCMYLAYSPGIPWGLSTAGCLILLVAQYRLRTRAADVA